MNRTKALIVVGCIMLALAVMAVMELRREVAVVAEGQTVTGALSKDAPPPVRTAAEAPTAPLGGAVPPNMPLTPAPAAETAPIDTTQRNTGLTSLEPGTLHPENTAPKAVQTPPAAQPMPAATPAAPPAASAKPEQAKPEQAKPEQVKPEQAKPEQAKPEQAKPETAKVDAKADPKADPKATQTKPEQAKPEQAKAEQAKADDKADDKNDAKGAVRAIDTAGPVRVDPGQKAIVWTRLELADKSVVFRLSGAEKLEAKSFVLPNPDRFVVDLQGSWAMRLPAVPANGILQKLRAGKQENNTRLVMDLNGARNCQMVRINPTTLEFRIK